VVASSSAVDHNTSEMPRGIAVNRDGTVLTTLPCQPNRVGAFDAAVKFRYNFNSSGRPAYVLNRAPFSSWGMAADKNGNFYVTTGSLGSTFSGGQPAIIVVNRSASRVLGGVASTRYLGKSDDIAINPSGTTGYVVDRINGGTYRFNTRSFTSGNRLKTIPAGQKLEDIRNDFSALDHPSSSDNTSDLNDPAIQPEATSSIDIQLTAFPNPTTDWVTIQLKADTPQDFVLHLVDSQGKNIWMKEVDGTQLLNERVDLTQLPQGMYFLRVQSGGDNQTHTIVKR
jgi:hypothetical protein